MKLKELLETIKDTSRDYVGTNGCLYQDISREELDIILNEIERLNNIINELEKDLKEAYSCLVPNELVNGRDLITNISNDLKELKEKK